jgi:hypothetical protein
VGVFRTGEPQRGTEDQDRNGECVPDGECEGVHGFPLNADSGRPQERCDQIVAIADGWRGGCFGTLLIGGNPVTHDMVTMITEPEG